MKAITLRQPWASLVARCAKTFETRSWQTSHRGLLAIHAGLSISFLPLSYDEPFRSALWDNGLDTQLPLGAVLCIVELIGCYQTTSLSPSPLERKFGDWSAGRYAWKLEVHRVFDNPPKVSGMLGLWNWPDKDIPNG